MRVLMAVLVLLLGVAGGASAQATTIVLVRHAEKVDDSRDPALSPAGVARAAALADALAHAGIGAVYTTQYERTRATGAPLAERLGITPVVISTGGADHAATVAARVRADGAPTVALVVGHSNSVPGIIRALGGPELPQIADEEYDNLYVVLIDEGGVRLVRAKY